jgi:hypothetical protein
LKPTGGNKGNGERLPSVFSLFSCWTGTKVETEALPSRRMSHPLGRRLGGGRAAISLGEGGGRDLQLGVRMGCDWLSFRSKKMNVAFDSRPRPA